LPNNANLAHPFPSMCVMAYDYSFGVC